MGLLVEWTKVSIPKLFFHAFRGGDLAGLLDHVSPKKMKLSFLWNVFAKAWMGPWGKGEKGGGRVGQSLGVGGSRLVVIMMWLWAVHIQYDTLCILYNTV